MVRRYTDSSVDNFVEMAMSEIENQYGKRVRTNRKTLLKFGRNTNVGTAESTINFQNIVPVRSSTNSIDTISSSSTSDVGKMVTLDTMVRDDNGDFAFVFQVVTLNGQTPVAIPTASSRITRIKRAIGSDLEGNVYAYESGATTAGVPNDLGTVGNVLSAAEQTTLFAGTTVAATNYFVITSYHADLTGSNAQGAVATTRLSIASKDNALFRTVDITKVNSDVAVEKSFYPYLIVPPNHDVKVTAEGGTSGLDVAASFQGFFVDIIQER